MQRCLVHIHRNNITDLTTRPRTSAGKALLSLSRRLLHLDTLDQAAHWVGLLAQFYNEYEEYLKERTYARQDPQEARKRGKKPDGWWYTHGRDRSVYQRLDRLQKAGQLFAYLTTEPGRALARTTNHVESINRLLADQTSNHPGLSEQHMTSAAEWLLQARTENPQTPSQIIKNWNHQNQPTRALIPKKTTRTRPIGPAQYDTGLTAEEGLWTRKGWAGRHQP